MMLTVKEKWTGSLVLDEQARTLCVGGKQTIPLGQIEDAAVCGDTVVRFGKKDADKGTRAALLCLRLKTPVAQPGRMVGLLKNANLVLRLESTEDARKIAAYLPAAPAGQMWTDETFPVDRCVVEAKRGCCDYIRGGTLGSNPYGKAGLVSPTILPQMHLQQGGVTIRYLGTNRRYQESGWFSAHPEEFFAFASSDDTVYALSLKESGCTASALYQCMAVERDENATGLWQVSMEMPFTSVCDGARWLAALQASATGEFCNETAQEAPQASAAPAEQEPPASAPVAAPAYDTAMLLAALDLLHAAQVLTDEEWRAKRKTLKQKDA